MQIRHRHLVPLLGCAMVAQIGCSQLLPVNRDTTATPKQHKPVAVKTVSVTQEDLKRTSVQPATVHAFYTASIQAKVHGYVTEVKADIGDAVKSGDVLAVINVPEMAQQRKVAEARIARQKAEEARAKSGVELAKSEVESAEALASEAESKLQQVEAALTAVEAEFGRTEDLVERGSVQRRLLDEVRKRRDSEVARKSAMTSAIASAKANVNVAKSKAIAAEADFQATKAETAIRTAELQEIDELINYATLKAPFSGVVTSRNVSPGDLVSERSTAEPLFVVSQLDKVRIHVPVPESEAAFVDRGDEISVTFPSFPSEEPLTVSVTRLTQSLDPGTRTMLVEAEVANSDGKLLPGMFGQASIVLGTNTATAMLPARAVRFGEDGKAFVYVVTADEVSLVPVVTGLDDGKTIEIVSGLESGQTVIDAHLKRFTNGQKVRILN